MKKNPRKRDKNKLYKAFLNLKNVTEVKEFCTDIFTFNELECFYDRLLVAKSLKKGMSQREISSKYKISISTITKVQNVLNLGGKGYDIVLPKTSKEILTKRKAG